MTEISPMEGLEGVDIQHVEGEAGGMKLLRTILYF